ncbi:MAG TPA: OmpA family protein, partial [Flammeovirgaceae bacterium]|nr:OmpA family protein [Flammeovirgaceae bacterium]
ASNPDTTILNSPDSTAIAIKDHQQDSVGADNLQKLLLALGNENSIQFSFNSAEINEQSMRKLEQLAGILKEYPRTTVILVGHTDNIGSTRQNKILSMQRARAAADVLVALGVAHSQIIVQGRGASEPIASNATEEGRSKNRRIEFFIINE